MSDDSDLQDLPSGEFQDEVAILDSEGIYGRLPVEEDSRDGPEFRAVQRQDPVGAPAGLFAAVDADLPASPHVGAPAGPKGQPLLLGRKDPVVGRGPTDRLEPLVGSCARLVAETAPEILTQILRRILIRFQEPWGSPPHRNYGGQEPSLAGHVVRIRADSPSYTWRYTPKQKEGS